MKTDRPPPPPPDAAPPPPPPPPLPEPPRGPVHQIEDAPALAAFARRLEGVPRLALDTESNSLFAYTERTCVVQISAGGLHAIVDALAVPDLSALGRVIAHDGVEVILHGGDYDVRVLSRDHGFTFGRVFDTMIAATLLGLERVGLADLVAQHFGVTLDKALQRADWGRRPLEAEHLEYLHCDTLYLEPLAAHLAVRLAEADLEEEAQIEFRRLATRQGQPAAPDPEGWRKAKGARDLDAEGRAVLAALWAWREDEARRIDRPPFKVVGPRELVALAQPSARRARDPGGLGGLPPALRRRHGRALVEVLAQGRAAAARGAAPPARSGPAPDADERRAERERRAREDVLRRWRQQAARERGVPNLVVLPNPALEWILERRPRTPDDLALCPDLGPKRIARYGEALLRLLPAH